MNSTVISGSYYDIGYKTGSQWKSVLELPVPLPAKQALARQCREIAQEYTPDLLEEMKGFCDGGNFDREAIEAFLLVLGYEFFHPSKGGCTVFGIAGDLTDSGFPIFARNYDWDVTFQPMCGVSFRHPLGRLKSVSFSDHMIGCYGGVNEAGLAIAILLASDFGTEWLPGIRVNLSSRWVLDHHQSTEEAVAFLEEIPHVRGQLFMIADKGGHIARVETSPPHLQTTHAEKGYLFSTNHYQAESLKRHSNPAFITPNSLTRFEKVKDFIENRKEKISVKDVMTFLSSHANGVCNHLEFEGVEIATIYSWIAEIRDHSNPIQLWSTTGSPCKNPYEQLSYFYS